MATTSQSSGLPTPGPLLQGRIDARSFRIATVITLAAAVSTVIGRFIATFPSQRKRLRADDIFLIFATIFLIAATTLILISVDQIYFIESLGLNGPAAFIDSPFASDWIGTLVFYQQFMWAYLCLTWASIFCVKFSFLTFFAGLCDRLPKIERYRKAVFVICAVVFIFALLEGIVVCPHIGIEATQCKNDPAIFDRGVALGTAVIVLDVMTDIMILVIPITLLWKVKLRSYQKLTIGIFLCLSIVMIIVAIVRDTGIKYLAYTDNSWIYLWQQVEAGAAVTMVSLTAFRSVFVSGISKQSKYRPWEASLPVFIRKMRKSSSSIGSDEFDLNHHVAVPRATLTGMRTFIGRGDEEWNDSFSKAKIHIEHRVDQQMSD